MSSDLTELGQEAIAAVSRGVADGAPLVTCQLLASVFYEALRHELRKADAAKRSTLLAVTHQCHRSGAANISPVQALDELRRAVDLLQPAMPGSETVQPVPRSRPVLRVIQGGLSSSQQSIGYGELESPGSREVYDQLKFGRPLHRQFSRFRTL
jgi:hypothetical protein